jgi:hypothetical protein
MATPASDDLDPERIAEAADDAWRAGASGDAAALRVRVLRLLLATRDAFDPVLELVDQDTAHALQRMQDQTIEALIRPALWPLTPLVRAVAEAEAEVMARLCGSSG